MTDFDLDRLGDMWRQPPDAAELERLQRTARSVGRRARLQYLLDVTAAVVVAGAVLFLVVSSGRPDTAVIGGAAILVLLVNSIRQRRLRQVELRSLSGATEDMLDQSIERVETTLRHNRVTLVVIGPAIGLAMLFAATAEGGETPIRSVIGAVPWLRVLWFAFGIGAIAGIFVFLLYAIRRGKRELERLRALRNSFHAESS